MEKKVLTEIALFYGDVSMPKGFEIDRSILCVDTLKHSFRNLSNPTLDFPFSRFHDAYSHNPFLPRCRYPRLDKNVTKIRTKKTYRKYVQMKIVEVYKRCCDFKSKIK